MAIIKCKMCGGDLNIEAGKTVAECEYCGTRQTVPTADNEKKLTLFARANRLRAACEFDKAAAVYESIVAEFPTEAEAYWGLVLCRYGIEYVDDPATGKKIPTCHRSSFESILEDPDFEQAQENADAVSRKVYREEAKAIEDIRRRIVELSGKEQPYDIFICYKETDENGERTPDSVMAQEVYDALTEKGLRVFFSRITLEDKLGTEYEPYIFAALNSAKVMLVFGTDYEYFNAVWVKNEWSRFLALIASGQKKHLIPCYKGVDAYDMPKEFAHLQGQDMGKVGAVQDLVRGVEKLLGKGPAQAVIVQAPDNSISGNISPMLERGFICLRDADFNKADHLFEQVLNLDPYNARAYLGKLMKERKVCIESNLAKEKILLQRSKNFQHAIEYADMNLKQRLEGYAHEVESTMIHRGKDGLLSYLDRRKEEFDHNNAVIQKNKLSVESHMRNMDIKIKGYEKEISNLEQELRMPGERSIVAPVLIVGIIGIFLWAAYDMRGADFGMWVAYALFLCVPGFFIILGLIGRIIKVKGRSDSEKKKLEGTLIAKRAVLEEAKESLATQSKQILSLEEQIKSNEDNLKGIVESVEKTLHKLEKIPLTNPIVIENELNTILDTNKA